jgi:hypothetical protein
MRRRIELDPEFVYLMRAAEEKNLSPEVVYLALMDMKDNKNTTPLQSLQIACEDLNIK